MMLAPNALYGLRSCLQAPNPNLGEPDLKMAFHRLTAFSSPWRSQALVRILLVLLLLPGLGLSLLPTGQAQTPASVGFTEGLKFEEVSPGIEYGQTTSRNASNDEMGPWFINVLRIDLKQTKLKIVRALDEGVGMETVSSMAVRHRADAATNGGYFRLTGPYRGESIGLLVLNGKLISEPYNERGEFGLIDKGKLTEVVFGHLRFSGELSAGRAKHKVAGVNRPISPDELIIFTPEFHRTTLTNPDGVEAIIRGNRVIAVNDLKGSSEIPADGYVISAVGSARNWVKAHLRKGSRVTFSWRLSPIEPGGDALWQRAYSILSAGPQLIKAGKVAITDREEKMLPTFRGDLHPRTAIARLGTGKLVLVTVDGRQPGVSMGMSLNTLADLLLDLGAVDGLNLDGGGSTTMVVKGKVVNKPSDQTGERPVSDAILVFSKPN
jgi:exopolysaccharide biosynthesis protein